MIFARALGEFDPSQFTCGTGSNGVFRCVGTDTDAIAAFFAVQRQANRLRAALAANGHAVSTIPRLSVDGAIGTDTQTVASILMARLFSLGLVGSFTGTSVEAVQENPSIENVATFAGDLAVFFGTIAAKLEATAPRTPTGELVVPPEDADAPEPSGMSTGAKVALGVVGAAVVAGGALAWRRWRRR